MMSITLKSINDELYYILNDAVKCLYSKFDILLYGSYISEMNDSQSDIDITIMIYDAKVSDTIAILQNVKTYIMKRLNIQVDLIPSARIPILSMKHKGLEYDISVNNGSGFVNSVLLSKLNQTIKEEIKVLKNLLKSFKLIDSKKGLFKSYNVNMLYLYYLTKIKVLDEMRVEISESQDISEINEVMITGNNIRIKTISNQVLSVNNNDLKYNLYNYSILVPTLRNRQGEPTRAEIYQRVYEFLSFFYNQLISKNKVLIKLQPTVEKSELSYSSNTSCELYLLDPFTKKVRPLHYAPVNQVVDKYSMLFKKVRHANDIESACIKMKSKNIVRSQGLNSAEKIKKSTKSISQKYQFKLQSITQVPIQDVYEDIFLSKESPFFNTDANLYNDDKTDRQIKNNLYISNDNKTKDFLLDDCLKEDKIKCNTFWQTDESKNLFDNVRQVNIERDYKHDSIRNNQKKHTYQRNNDKLYDNSIDVLNTKLNYEASNSKDSDNFEELNQVFFEHNKELDYSHINHKLNTYICCFEITKPNLNFKELTWNNWLDKINYINAISRIQTHELFLAQQQ